MFNRESLFGNRQPPPPGQRQPVRQQPPPPSSSAYDQPPRYSEDPRRAPHPAHQQSRGGAAGGRMQLKPAKSPDELIYNNVCAVSPHDVSASQDAETYLLLQGQFVLAARPHPKVESGTIGLNEVQRTWMQLALTDVVDAELYDPFRQGKQCYLGSTDIEVGFAGIKASSMTTQPFDQDELAERLVKAFRNQIFAPGQMFIMDTGIKRLKCTVKTVELVDLASLGSEGQQETHPHARGMLTPETRINFYKDAKSPINLKGSTRRPAANSIIRPDFKFEDLGIGGLDKEFSDIFRRAFASRIVPPGLADKLGIQHVRGILLYGPPGTGKTLIARQIGKMLNAREPKVINGPEVLNKYVGQSEENIRKLFADAEKEQKEKGDESGLHIIIFDELDAVCKQRGSGAGGGTGVGDSVVNQLLSKLDGVEQLNNILLIGMTNRKDMIDEALLRSGRLEVHMEISLPDEPGRKQILKIHTAKMRENNKLASDVDLAELAKHTRNFSGAEIGGLVKAASSFALQRHIKGGTVAALTDDIGEIQLRMQDFLNALQEVKPLFGVSEEDLERCTEGGIIRFGPHIDKILRDGQQYVQQVRTSASQHLSVLLHGPSGSGKTTLAAQIALNSQFPFIKLVKAVDMVGMNEIQKIQHLSKVFTDAYKSPLNVLVLDEIEMFVDWVPVGPRFSSAVLAALKGLMGNKPPKGRPLLIIATTSERSVLQQLQLKFNAEIAIPNVRQNELPQIMEQSGEFSSQDIQRAVSEIGDFPGGVGIQQVILAIQTAVQDPDRVGRFVEVMGEKIHM